MINLILSTLHKYSYLIKYPVKNIKNPQCLCNSTAKRSSTNITNSELYRKACEILCNTDMKPNASTNKPLKQSYNEAYKTYIDKSKMILKTFGKDDTYISEKINDIKSNLVYDKITGGVYDKRFLNTENS